MCSVLVIFGVALSAQAHNTVLEANQTVDTQEHNVMDNLVNKLIDIMVDKLLDQALKVSRFHQVDLGDTTLSKTSHLARPTSHHSPSFAFPTLGGRLRPAPNAIGHALSEQKKEQQLAKAKEAAAGSEVSALHGRSGYGHSIIAAQVDRSSSAPGDGKANFKDGGKDGDGGYGGGEIGRLQMARRGALMGLVGAVAASTKAEENSNPAPPGCVCSAKAQCPTTGPSPDWFWDPQATSGSILEPILFTTWSPVTGRCLPWGPGGPLGVLASAAFFRLAVKSQALMSFLAASLLLFYSAPRSQNGELLALIAAAVGLLLGALPPSSNGGDAT